MKTAQDILNFYGIEVGKKYRITAQTRNSNYIGKEFIVENVKRLSGEIWIKINDVVYSISRLNTLDYEEVKPEILDSTEKKYLLGIIKPFKDKVGKIYKREATHLIGTEYKEFICIEIEDDASICLPNFNKGSMYKGMKIGKKYTPEELNL